MKPEWLDQIRTQVTAHLAEGYFAAHAVTLGQLSQRKVSLTPSRK